MLNRRSILILGASGASLLVAMLLGQGSCASGVTDDVYVFNRQDLYFGPTLVYLGTTGCKVEFPNYKTEIIARSPSWKIVAYNKDNNMAFEMSLEHWVNRGLRRVGDLSFMDQSSAENGFDRNLKLKVIRLRHISHESSGMKIEGFYRAGNNKNTEIAVKELIYTNEIPVSDKARQFIQGMVRTPPKATLPLTYSWYDAAGKKYPVWTTQSMEHKTFSTSIFDYPKNYKLTKNEDDVLMGGVRQKELVGIFDDLLGDDKNAKPKK